MEQKLFDAAAKLPEASLAFDDIENSPKAETVKKPPRVVWTIVACIALAICIGFGSFALVAEAKEYQDALVFFDTYELSAEGLTREEIKTVYRDITEETFSNPITAEVILNSMAYQVGGYEINQSESVKNLWNIFNSTVLPPRQPAVTTGIHYKYRNEYAPDNALKFENAYLEKYDGETLLWSLEIFTSPIREYFPVSDGVFVFGSSGGLTTGKAWLARVDNNGQLLWIKMPEHGFEGEHIYHVLENGDGTYAVISRVGLNHICLSRYSADGQELFYQKTEVGNYGIGAAAKLSGGYGVQLFSFMENEHSKIIRLDEQGNITDTFDYGNEEVDYHITDMMEHNGKLYLSTYVVPKATDEGGRHEIANILDYVFDNNKWRITSEELTPIVRQNYTAVLLVCDPASGTPQTFFSVEGSLGGKLAYGDNGSLLWDVESITSTFFSPATSAFSIAGACTVFRYAFGDGSVSQWATGETTGFYR